jgi:hypothetical protein
MWWFFGLPFGSWLTTSTLLTFSAPTVSLVVGMIVVLAGMTVLGRRALNY